MKLIHYRVKNYRSISDSGLIEVGKRTALVGRNESGKTNLLLALQAVNPPEGRALLTWVKDFPRDRPKSEFNEELEVARTIWELSDAERQELADIFPRVAGVRLVEVVRDYTITLSVDFVDLPPVGVDQAKVDNFLRALAASLNASTRSNPEAATTVGSALSALRRVMSQPNGDVPSMGAWAARCIQELDAVTTMVTAQGISPTGKADAALFGLRKEFDNVVSDDAALRAGRDWVATRLPIFIYLADYPELEGHQALSSFLERLRTGVATRADENFQKLMKVAELDAQELSSLLTTNHEERQQLTNRASAHVSRTIRRLWTDRHLTVRFNVDEDHFDTLIADPNAIYPTEVNLNERSRGFKWFFSFYVTFAADTAGGPATNAILLFDEPGLYLHATAQRDLLKQFESDFVNQVIYTTHSPFMIPVDALASIRTVNISADAGTTVTNDPTGDSKTLFPLQAALGFEIAQTLFVGRANLVVEGVTDYWYLSSFSEWLNDREEGGLARDIAITPAGGASKVTYLVSLLGAQNLEVVVLLDDEPNARQQAFEFVRAKLIRDDYILYASAGFAAAPVGGADIEDLLDADVYDRLCRESYAAELSGKALAPRQDIPRLVKRYEQAFSEAGMSFNKLRPAKLFLRKVATAPEEVFTEPTVKRFKTLLGEVTSRFDSIRRRDAGPFR